MDHPLQTIASPVSNLLGHGGKAIGGAVGGLAGAVIGDKIDKGNDGGSYGQWADMTVPGGYGAVSPYLPNFTGTEYAPINFTPAPSAYSPIPTSIRQGDKHGAEKLNAQLIREQYADYERRFQPIEDLAINMITDTGTKDLPYDLARTRTVVGGVFDSLQGQQDRAMQRFGQVNKADPIKGSNAQASATVGGLNAATFADEERRMRLLGGGSSTAAGALNDATTGGK